MLHDDEVAFIFIRNADIVQESLGGFAHDHGAEKLSTEPGATSGRDACFDDGNLQVRSLLGKLVGCA